MSDKRSERMLEELLKVPGNNYCADCRTPSPRWASVNLGITLCVACATIHRKLGTHKSRVKSITLDTWSREHIQTLRSIGNNASNAIYCPNEQKNPPPTSTDSSERDSEMEKYIRRKYELGAFKAGASPGKAAEGVNSRDRYRAAQSLDRDRGIENRRNPELNNLVFKKNSREERDLPPLPPLSASRTGSSAGGGGGPRERPKPTTIPPPLETETMLINLGGATRATLPLQSQLQPQPQQIPTFTQNGNGSNGQSQFIPQTQFQSSPQQTQTGYFPAQQQYTNNPFMQSQLLYPQQQQFLSPSTSPSLYGPYANGAMGTSPGGTNPFLQMNQGQQQMGPGQMYGQGQAQGHGWNGNGSGQGQQMQNGWQGQGQPQQQFQQPQQQYAQQQQGWSNMGMAGMGMGYAQGH